MTDSQKRIAIEALKIFRKAKGLFEKGIDLLQSLVDNS
jgi:hypothetical protein